MKKYLEYKDEKSHKFWEIEVKDNSYTVTYGKLGSKGRSSTKTFDTAKAAQQDAEKVIKAKIKKGYSDPKEDVFNGAKRGLKGEISDELVEHIISLSSEGHIVQENLNYFENSSYDTIYFKGDIHIAGNLNTFERMLANVIIEGNLVVEGTIFTYDDPRTLLLVTGNIVAKNLHNSGYTICNNSIILEQALIGDYNHGFVQAKKIECKVVYSEHMVEEGNPTGYRCMNEYDINYFEEGKMIPDLVCEAKGIFKKTLVADGRLDIQKVFKYLTKDKPVLLDEFVTIEEQLFKLIEKKLKAPEKVKTLDFSGKSLTRLPKELHLFTNIQTVKLSDNKLKEFPEFIRNLKDIEDLDLDFNEIGNIPDWIGELKSLRFFNLRSNRQLKELPETIGELENLEWLNLSQTAVQKLPSSLSKCTQLKSVFIRYLNKTPFMKQLPVVLTQLPNLEKLDIRGSLISILPEVPFVSKKLETISLEETAVTKVDFNKEQYQLDEDNNKWLIKTALKPFEKMKYPPYSSRTKTYDVFTEKDLADIIAILELVDVEKEMIERDIRKELRYVTTYFNYRGYETNAVRKIFSESVDILKTFPASPIQKLLLKIFTHYTNYEIPGNPDTIIHLVPEAYLYYYSEVKDKKSYSEFYEEQFNEKVPFCDRVEILDVANKHFDKGATVIIWELSKSKLKKDPDNIEDARLKPSIDGTLKKDFGGFERLMNTELKYDKKGFGFFVHYLDDTIKQQEMRGIEYPF